MDFSFRVLRGTKSGVKRARSARQTQQGKAGLPVLQACLDTNSAENKIIVLSTLKNMKLAKLHTTKK